jgi:hypothetical protein
MMPVHSRSLRALSALAVASTLTLGFATSAHAGPKDKDAEKLLTAAIDGDYLNADFDKAESKLRDAVKKCGSSGCSGELLGKIHIALGTVLGVGLSKPADAKDEFVLALKADSGAALDPNLSNPELQKIFADAKKSHGGGAAKPDKPEKPEKPAPSGDASHTPPPESPVNTPLPIYVEPSDDVAKVILKYKSFGADKFKNVELKKVGSKGGYGGEIPCEDLTTTGDVKYYFSFAGSDGDTAGGLGTKDQPFKTTIKNELDGDAPKLPGKKAPVKCVDKADCPPGMESPECPVKKPKGGEKGWGASCDNTAECKEGLACLNGTCDESKGDDDGGKKKDDPAGAKRMNLVGVFAQLDFLSLKSTSAACDGSNVQYECFISGSTNQFIGTPVPFGTTDGIQGGGAFAGARILAAYDRQLSRRVGITLGLRIGGAFGGPGAPTNVDMKLANGQVPIQPVATKFLPLHLEGRLSWYILGSMMDDKKFRPYFFAGGGIGQVNASVPVAVCDSNIYTINGKPEPGQSCNVPGAKPTLLRSVDAYQVTGLGFIDFGVGTTFGITPLFGIAAEMKFMFMVPTFGVGIAPNIGPVFNF